MEVDAASDDSDATVADEEDPPTAAVIPQLTESQATQNWTGHSGRRPGSVPSQAAAAPPRCSGSTGAVNGRADDGEDAGPSSPSLLQGGSTLVNRLESQSTKLGCSDMEVVPNSSGEGSTCDEMSQEFPPLTATGPSKLSANKTKAVMSEDSRSLQQSVESLCLSSVLQDQDKLLAHLSSLVDDPPRMLVDEAKKKAQLLEENLKTTNLNNQAERKKLAAAHSDLLSQCNSQEELSQGSLSLRAQLLQLAGRQKQLLECFKKQKEIKKLLSDLEEKIKFTASRPINPEISAVGSSVRILETEKSSLGVTSRAARDSSLSAALPNLVRHLRQPFSQSQSQLPVLPSSQLTKSFTSAVAATNPSHAATSVTYHVSRPLVHSVSMPQVQRQQYSQPTVSVSQSINSCSSRPTTTAAAVVPTVPQPTVGASGGGGVKLPLSSDLAQPVPLEDLIKHGFIKPGDGCLSCVVMGCEFKASLLKDGSIKDPLSGAHQFPHQWFKACWAKLGHAQKKPSKKSTYTSVFYHGVPLIQFCEKYSLKQVNSYLSGSDSRKTSFQPTLQPTEASMNKSNLPPDSLCSSTSSNEPNQAVRLTVSGHVQLSCSAISVDGLLRNGQVWLHNDLSEQTSLNLPTDFWTGDKVTLSKSLHLHFEQDLQW